MKEKILESKNQVMRAYGKVSDALSNKGI
jgi:hypothetical protein